jgi:hypothetical protein
MIKHKLNLKEILKSLYSDPIGISGARVVFYLATGCVALTWILYILTLFSDERGPITIYIMTIIIPVFYGGFAMLMGSLSSY